ncbi:MULTISPECIES: twin-arginine translocase subunit TatC [Actinomadura]|uniref:Sec-independent protein translocase protein TatC n=1 Tax=Actinomadura yumaensis TaxID=111807 RepID=A0ABW2CYC4_9ACTN|nr:twin-arginine translocase subunit TatC [Actinomadura sp. J1-007]MWK39311.1 twin-arginine translocase subunit TatC [Actinomadura sp. J1-007]
MKRTTRQAADPDGRMPLMDHLRELRNRLIKAILGLTAGTIVGFIVFDPVWTFLQKPYCKLPEAHRVTGGQSCALVTNGLTEGFFLHLKIAFMIGVVVSSPIWLYQIWAFVAPGLYRRERRWTYTFMGAAVPLFLAGAVLSYITLDKGLSILLGFVPDGAVPLVTVTSYLGYASAMLLVFGLAFELPLLVVILNLAGVLTFERLRKTQRISIFLIFLFAAVATPSADPFTMLALAVPTLVLFEAAVVIAMVNDRRRARRPDPYADLADDEAAPLDLERIDAELEKGDPAPGARSE